MTLAPSKHPSIVIGTWIQIASGHSLACTEPALHTPGWGTDPKAQWSFALTSQGIVTPRAPTQLLEQGEPQGNTLKLCDHSRNKA